MTAVILAGLAALSAASAQERGNTPGDAAPPPPIPPLPAKVQDEQIEPTVRITTNEEEEIIEEYSSNGRVYMVKVTPAHGKPYFYMDMDGDGQLELQDRDEAFSPVKPVVWKVKEW
jgi:hypothetical protein